MGDALGSFATRPAQIWRSRCPLAGGGERASKLSLAARLYVAVIVTRPLTVLDDRRGMP
jgi:hypothetical protein